MESLILLPKHLMGCMILKFFSSQGVDYRSLVRKLGHVMFTHLNKVIKLKIWYR